MSVLKSQRKESPFEVLDFYCKLRKEFLELTYRNFGYKGLEAFINSLLAESKVFIANALRECHKYITISNAISPVFLWECDERRKGQDLAIGMLYSVLQELQFVLASTPSLDKNKFVRYSDMIKREISLIKGWRQSDNRIRNKILQQNGQGNI